MGFPPIPPEIKSIAHVLKVADEHDQRNIVVSYWARMYACQSAMKLIPGKKPPAVSALLIALMDWLEETKKAHPDVEGITNETVAQAEIEAYALQLFNYADGQDRQELFHKNMIKAFYTAGILMDILEQFDNESDEMVNKKKYAKWKAAYIHNCLKSGEKPTAGGIDDHLNNIIDLRDQPGYVADGDGTETTEGEDGASGGGTSSWGQAPPPPSDSFNGGAPPGQTPPASSPVTPGGTEQHTPYVPPPASPYIPSPAASVPYVPQPVPTPAPPTTGGTGLLPSPTSTSNVTPEQISKAQKFCKYATSALNYDDVNTAIDNLRKALNMLQLGREG